jgi:hypothetical protein
MEVRDKKKNQTKEARAGTGIRSYREGTEL